MKRLRALMPTPDTVRRSRWLRWMGPALLHPALWHLSRRGVALGMALGIFFGVLIPIAQIPLSVGAAIAMRANVPGAVASTFVSNPVTFGPLYYAAWRIGKSILGEPVRQGEVPPEPEVSVPAPDEGWFAVARKAVLSAGKPLLVGLIVMASSLGLLTYLLVSSLWVLRVRWKRRRRRSRAASARSRA